MARNRRERRGVMFVYVSVMMVAILGFASLGVDFARVQCSKTELQEAATAAARAAVVQLGNGISATQNTAVTWGGYNKANGASVVIDGTNDVVFGTWSTSTRTFTPLSGAARSGANAVRINAHLAASRGTGVPLMFGQLVGQSTCDVSATATATSGYQTGLIGFGSISIHNNLYVGSYNSASTTSPTQGTAGSSSFVASNGTIGVGAGSGDSIHGNVEIGPSGSVNNTTVSGTTTTLTSSISAPSLPTFPSGTTNPGSVSRTPTINANTTWPGGTYYLTSLTMNNSFTLSFSGPATIYINGNVTIGDHDIITPYNSVPGNLVIYQANSDTFTIHDNGSITAEIIAPGATFTAHDNDVFEGSFMFGADTFHDSDSVYTDSELTGANISLVQ